MRLYPAPNRMVRDPITRAPIPQSGIEVATIADTSIPVDVFWRRRLRDADVSATDPALPPAASVQEPPVGQDHDSSEEHPA